MYVYVNINIYIYNMLIFISISNKFLYEFYSNKLSFYTRIVQLGKT